MGNWHRTLLTGGAWCVLLLALACWGTVVHSVWSGKAHFTTASSDTGGSSLVADADAPGHVAPPGVAPSSTPAAASSTTPNLQDNSGTAGQSAAAAPTKAAGRGGAPTNDTPQHAAVGRLQRRARRRAVQRVLAVLSGAASGWGRNGAVGGAITTPLGALLATSASQHDGPSAWSLPQTALLLRTTLCQLHHLVASPPHVTSTTASWVRDDTTNEGCAMAEAAWDLPDCRKRLDAERVGVHWVVRGADGVHPYRGGLTDDALYRLRDVYVYQAYRRYLDDEDRSIPNLDEAMDGSSARRAADTSATTAVSTDHASWVVGQAQRRATHHRLVVVRPQRRGRNAHRTSVLCVPRDVVGLVDDHARLTPPAARRQDPVPLPESAVAPSRNATRVTKWTADQLRVAFLMDLSIAVEVGVGSLLQHAPLLRRNASLNQEAVRSWHLPLAVWDALLLDNGTVAQRPTTPPPTVSSPSTMDDRNEAGSDDGALHADDAVADVRDEATMSAELRSNDGPPIAPYESTARSAPPPRPEATDATRRQRMRALTTLCMYPKLRAILLFSMQHHWLLPLFPPPLTEADVVDRLHYEPGERVMENVSFTSSCNRKKPLSTTTLGGRNRPVFYSMGNVVLSAAKRGGGPLRGFGIRTNEVQRLDLMRDESFVPVADVVVRSRRMAPRFVVRSVRPLYLLPVGAGGDDLVRVVFRYISAVTLLRRLGMHNNAAVFGYLILPSAPPASIGDGNFYRTFYHSVHGPWLSYWATDRPAAAASSRHGDNVGDDDDESVFDLAFRSAVTGFDGISRAHKATTKPPGGSGAAPGSGSTELMLFRKNALQRLKPAAMALRQTFAECLQLPSTAVKRMRLLPPIAAAASQLPTAGSQRIDAAAVHPPIVQVVLLGGGRRGHDAPPVGGILNGTELMQGYLRSLQHAGATGGGRAEAVHVLVVAEYDALTVAQQAAVARSADVVIGPQGTSGFAWMLLMKPRSVAVAIQDPLVGSDDPDPYACGGAGINDPQARLGCDYAKLAAAAHVHQIAFVAKSVGSGGLAIGASDFIALMDSALCCLGKRDEDAAAAECTMRRPFAARG